MSSFEQKSGASKPQVQGQNQVQPASQQVVPQVQGQDASRIHLPADITFQNAAKLSIVEDKPIMLDYWTSSLEKKSCVGIRESGEKLLVKSAEEYTSPISKFYKTGSEYIIITENSIYLVSSDIPTRKIT